MLTSQHKRTEPLRVKRPDAIEAAVEAHRIAKQSESNTYSQDESGRVVARGNAQLLSYFAARSGGGAS